MQFRALAAVALLASAPGVVGLSATATAENRAVAWLQVHRGAPNSDELSELKSANPSAYAIVKALLTKRSLGLLDPKHPSASFAVSKAAPQEVPGVEAFAKIAADSGDKASVAPVYAEAPTSMHHDWLNWKPSDSATNDEAMVNNVLGQVASLKGAAVAAPAVQVPDAPPVVDSAPHALDAAPKPKASMNQENSYLRGLDLDSTASTAKKVAQKDSGKDYLSSFSWDDAAPAAKVEKPKPAPTQQTGVYQTKEKKNALLDWLSPKAVQRVAAPTTAPAEENSYLKDLSLN